MPGGRIPSALRRRSPVLGPGIPALLDPEEGLGQEGCTRPCSPPMGADDPHRSRAVRCRICAGPMAPVFSPITYHVGLIGSSDDCSKHLAPMITSSGLLSLSNRRLTSFEHSEPATPFLRCPAVDFVHAYAARERSQVLEPCLVGEGVACLHGGLMTCEDGLSGGRELILSFTWLGRDHCPLGG